MEIPCPTCATPAPAEGVDWNRNIARCPRCGSLFDISERAGDAPSAKQRRRDPVPMPATFTVIEGAAPALEPGYRDAPAKRPGITIKRRWYTKDTWGLAVGCVLWNGFLALWYRLAAHTDAPLMFKLVPLIHVSVGVFFVYLVLAHFLNTTTITTDDDALTVRHHPVPWLGNRRLPCASIEQLFTEERVTQQRNGNTVTYDLVALLRDGQRQKLVTSLPEAEQALFLEQRIEERLGLVDVEVAGELPRAS